MSAAEAPVAALKQVPDGFTYHREVNSIDLRPRGGGGGGGGGRGAAARAGGRRGAARGGAGRER
ncbi:hypothetical protein, partial [Nocardia gipuzkoensis]|uniref:hypothetical protein n=1 Tax=Nocardia gipuzkoensis TaxID=2749991 RepID=UPI002453A9B1